MAGGEPEVPLGENVVKSVSPALATFLNNAISNPDAPIAFADCFTFTLKPTNISLTYTNVDQDIVFNGATYSAKGPLVQGVKYKCAVGLEVDKQQITLAARPTDLINGSPVLNAIAMGAFDGASFERIRVFMTALGQPIVGGVTLFKGRISTVDSVGRTSAQITIASDLVVLDYDMPHNMWSPTCNHVLYDSGCTLNKSNFAASGVVGPGSTLRLINSPVAAVGQLQGEFIFNSGINTNLVATVKTVVAGVSISLVYPMPNKPAVGDAFTVYFGCDHTQATCFTKFNNLLNFKGYPYVPPPQLAY